MTAVASSIKSIWPFLPVDRFLCFISWKVSNATRCGIEPFFLVDIVSNRECLKSPFFKESKEIVDVLSTHDMFDLVFLCLFGTCFNDVTAFTADVSTIFVFADYDFFFLWCEFGLCKLSRLRLHRKSVERRRPELIELLV